MAFVHGTTTTINDAPAEDLILDAAKETPTTLKLGHNAEKYAKVFFLIHVAETFYLVYV